MEPSSAHEIRQEKKLFTPGPLCVSSEVKKSLQYDLGSRDEEFIRIVKNIRNQLVEIAGLSPESFTSVLMQGSGTFAVESVLQSTSDRVKKVLILVSGSYGARMGTICSKAGIPHEILQFPENESIGVCEMKKVLSSSPNDFSSVALVECETTSGVLNDVEAIGKIIKEEFTSVNYIVDAMSSFGGVVTNYQNVDFLISSANKCLQGVPGFAFVIANKKSLEQCKGRSTSLSLDLFDQWIGLETSGQFRFTPPTHCILALYHAIKELVSEGGVVARAQRYAENNRIIKTGMGELGFSQFVRDDEDGHIITSFKYPKHPNFNFASFYNRLSAKGQLIYPGKVTNADCFRIGNIGHLFQNDMQHLLKCIWDVLTEMEIPLPLH